MPNVICGSCKKSFYSKPNWIRRGWGKYCSLKCRHLSQYNGKNVSCFICKNVVYRSQSRLKQSKSGNHFCGKKCQTIWRNTHFIGEKHGNWKGGTGSYRRILLKSNIKKYCVYCKNKDMRVLTAHHKDHNRKNNKLSNLIWLCLNCHHLTHKDLDFDKGIKSIDLKTL